MSNATYFVQECPTCGRRLQIRVEYLGRRVVCQHCQGALIAADPAMRTDLAQGENLYCGGRKSYWRRFRNRKFNRAPLIRDKSLL